MYLVTGATGNSGAELVKILKAKGLTVRAFSNDEKAEKTPGVDYVIGDFANEASIEKALEGVKRAYLLSPNTLSQVAHEQNFIRIAEKLGLELVVKVSSTTPDKRTKALSIVHKWHGEIEEFIQDTELNYVFLRLNFYMQNLRFMVPNMKDDILSAPASNTRIGMIDTRDIAEVAAVCLTDKTWWNRSYLLSGPEAITFSEVARELGNFFQRHVQYKAQPLAEYEKAMSQLVSEGWRVQATVKDWEIGNSGGFSLTSDYVKTITGKDPRSLRQFLNDHRAWFL